MTPGEWAESADVAVMNGSSRNAFAPARYRRRAQAPVCDATSQIAIGICRAVRQVGVDTAGGVSLAQCWAGKRKCPGGIPGISTWSNLGGGYGVRSAVTSRASRTVLLPFAVRRHEASKFGQAFSEQLRPTCLMSRRSPLAKATG